MIDFYLSVIVEFKSNAMKPRIHATYYRHLFLPLHSNISRDSRAIIAHLKDHKLVQIVKTRLLNM